MDGFSGWDYIVYDKYGHTLIMSQTFGSEKQAMKSLERELNCGKNKADAGPYTAVLFKTPASVVLKGRMFKIKNDVCTQINGLER